MLSVLITHTQGQGVDVLSSNTEYIFPKVFLELSRWKTQYFLRNPPRMPGQLFHGDLDLKVYSAFPYVNLDYKRIGVVISYYSNCIMVILYDAVATVPFCLLQFIKFM